MDTSENQRLGYDDYQFVSSILEMENESRNKDMKLNEELRNRIKSQIRKIRTTVVMRQSSAKGLRAVGAVLSIPTFFFAIAPKYFDLINNITFDKAQATGVSEFFAGTFLAGAIAFILIGQDATEKTNDEIDQINEISDTIPATGGMNN